MEGISQPEGDYGRRWYVMAAVGLSVFLATLDGSIVNVALPTLVRELRTDFPTVQWVVLSYLLTMSTLLLSVGRLGDMLGKKRIYAAGFVVFITGSFLCGLAPGVYWLIGARVLQAVGATMLLALGPAILTEAFPPSQRGRALGVVGAVVSAGIVAGPTVGGLLIDALSWHWIFMVNVPIGLIGTLVALRYVPATTPGRGQRFDFLGALTLCVSLLALLLALTLGQEIGFTQPPMLALFALSAVFLLAFRAVEARAEQPMIDLSLFSMRPLSIGLITGALTFISISGVVFLLPFYLEGVRGYPTRVVGLLMASVPVAMGLTSYVSGTLADRLGTRPIAITGLVVMFAGYIIGSTLTIDTSPAGYILRLLPLGIGMGIFQSPNNSAVMGAAPRERLGIVSGLLALTRTLGQTVGIAVLGALWASRVGAHSIGEELAGSGAGGATAAPPAVQVLALHETFLVISGLIAVGLLTSLWGILVREGSASPVLRREGVGP